jgi:hypothetical protein
VDMWLAVPFSDDKHSKWKLSAVSSQGLLFGCFLGGTEVVLVIDFFIELPLDRCGMYQCLRCRCQISMAREEPARATRAV